MREITTHKVNGLNEALTIIVMDEPGTGSACHVYGIAIPNVSLSGAPLPPGAHPFVVTTIQFQNGPIKEFGVNGVSNEALLAIVRDRLEGFQSGAFACLDNQDALESVKWAMEALSRRTRKRVERGVEGTNEP